MKHNKRLTNHLNKAYEHNEKARNIIQKELNKETDNKKISILTHYKVKTLDIKLKLKNLIDNVDELL